MGRCAAGVLLTVHPGSSLPAANIHQGGNGVNGRGTTESQADQILHYLQAGGRLTALDALRHGWGMRLSARVDDLKNRGYPVNSEMVERGGKWVAEYSMVPTGELFASARRWE